MAWQRQDDGSYSCDECGDSFPVGRHCSCAPAGDSLGDAPVPPGARVGSAGVLSLAGSRQRIKGVAARQRRIAIDAHRVANRADDAADADELARLAMRLSSLNVESAAADRELKALRAAAEMAAEAERIDVDRDLIRAARADLEADATAVH